MQAPMEVRRSLFQVTTLDLRMALVQAVTQASFNLSPMVLVGLNMKP